MFSRVEHATGIRPPQRMLRVPRLARTLLRAWNELLSTLINTNLCAKSHPCRAGKCNNRRELHSVKPPPAPAWTSLLLVAAAELDSKLAVKERAAKGTPAREARKHGSGSRCSPFQGWGCTWDHIPRVARRAQHLVLEFLARTPGRRSATARSWRSPLDLYDFGNFWHSVKRTGVRSGKLGARSKKDLALNAGYERPRIGYKRRV